MKITDKRLEEFEAWVAEKSDLAPTRDEVLVLVEEVRRLQKIEARLEAEIRDDDRAIENWLDSCEFAKTAEAEEEAGGESQLSAVYDFVRRVLIEVRDGKLDSSLPSRLEKGG